MALGISILAIFVLLSMIVSFRHSRISFGAVVFGVVVGLCLTGIFPDLAPAIQNSVTSVGNAFTNIDFK